MRKLLKLFAFALTACLVSVAFVACTTPEPPPAPNKYFESEIVFYLDLNQSPAAATYLLNNTKFTFRPDGTCTSVFGIVGMGDQTFERKYEIDGTTLTEVNEEADPIEEVIYNLSTVDGKKVLTREDGVMTFVESSEPIAYDPPDTQALAFDSAKKFVLDTSADNYAAVMLVFGEEANIIFATDGTCVSSVKVGDDLLPIAGVYELNTDGDELFMITAAGASTYDVTETDGGLLRITTTITVDGVGSLTVTYIEHVETNPYFEIPMVFVIDTTLTNATILAAVGATAHMTFATDGTCVSIIAPSGVDVPNDRTYSISGDTLTMLNPTNAEDIAVYTISYDEDGRMSISTKMYTVLDVVYVEADAFLAAKTFVIDTAKSSPLMAAALGATANFAFDPDGTCVFTSNAGTETRDYTMLGNTIITVKQDGNPEDMEISVVEGKLTLTVTVGDFTAVYVEQVAE